MWTYVQVAWCGAICLSAVCGPIYRLLVHQSEAGCACGSVRGLSQHAKKQIYTVNWHHATAASEYLNLPLHKFVLGFNRVQRSFCVCARLFMWIDTVIWELIKPFQWNSGVIFARNSISIISIFFKADIIDIISIFSKASWNPRCLEAQVHV